MRLCSKGGFDFDSLVLSGVPITIKSLDKPMTNFCLGYQEYFLIVIALKIKKRIIMSEIDFKQFRNRSSKCDQSYFLVKIYQLDVVFTISISDKV